MLTGKCKEDFEKWYMQDVMGYKDPRHYSQWFDLEMERFYSHLFSCKYGVYVDFFDSVGLFIEIYDWRKSSIWCYKIFQYVGKDFANEQITKDYEIEVGDTRTEARQKAILKANEIYNQNKDQ